MRDLTIRLISVLVKLRFYSVTEHKAAWCVCIIRTVVMIIQGIPSIISIVNEAAYETAITSKLAVPIFKVLNVLLLQFFSESKRPKLLCLFQGSVQSVWDVVEGLYRWLNGKCDYWTGKVYISVVFSSGKINTLSISTVLDIKRHARESFKEVVW